MFRRVVGHASIIILGIRNVRRIRTNLTRSIRIGRGMCIRTVISVRIGRVSVIIISLITAYSIVHTYFQYLVSRDHTISPIIEYALFDMPNL